MQPELRYVTQTKPNQTASPNCGAWSSCGGQIKRAVALLSSGFNLTLATIGPASGTGEPPIHSDCRSDWQWLAQLMASLLPMPVSALSHFPIGCFRLARLALAVS